MSGWVALLLVTTIVVTSLGATVAAAGWLIRLVGGAR